MSPIEPMTCSAHPFTFGKTTIRQLVLGAAGRPKEGSMTMRYSRMRCDGCRRPADLRGDVGVLWKVLGGEAQPVTQLVLPPQNPDDVLFGAGKIAEFLFGDVKHRRKIYYLTNAAKNGIPHFKIGQTTCASKSTLLRWITEQEEQNSLNPPALELARDNRSQRMSRRIFRALWRPFHQRWRWWMTTRGVGK